ncbi:polysaccharide biosynthesis protein [Paraglaciecola aquimarina]|uniref:Polysaccharide biosynthesis protein n=1 Tax=Paraglaciecola algarum TaxID=3050085 RepID=A0ABS9D428_9ALTE|nr:nucleoside-diphosphate sugar epimerase/dehydratase [Paraglaciecola sp. G1-23]MCF2947686.1 polysaccharide biosynthesis protein [Paraglaciecola sp. G1-23]
MIIRQLFELSPKHKLIAEYVWDICSLFCALIFAFWIRLGIDSWNMQFSDWLMIGLNTLFTILLLTICGHYRQIIRYMGLKAINITLLVLTFSVLFLFASSMTLDVLLPNSVPIIYWVLAAIAIVSPRILMQASAQSQSYKMREKCLIFGAAEAGRSLVQTLKAGNELQPVAFIDDKKQYQGKDILGLKVGKRDDIPHFVKKYGVTKMLLAVHNTSNQRRKELIVELEPYAIELLSIPNIQDILSGKRSIDELREIRIEELLGREPVPPIVELLDINIRGKNVMVTGAGGSIGSELCRQIAKSAPQKLILFELSEFNLYQIENELKSIYPGMELIPILASIQDTEMLRSIIDRNEIQTIYHAAAYKHVPMVESNPLAGIRNNVFGTSNVALVAAEFEVEKFVLISTDKAVRPTNIMGATKRFAELYIQGIAELGFGTEFAIVRFGNVLGSSGSVVPLFTKQIQAGGPITVTHPDITRYFMTIPEAAQLVIQAGAMGANGEVFVLDMGESVKIVDLAKKMAHLMGHGLKTDENPDGDIELKISGLRPGEKLYEELLIDDADTTTQHPRIMGADETKLPFEDVILLFDELNRLLLNNQGSGAKELLIRAPLAYTPAAH